MNKAAIDFQKIEGEIPYWTTFAGRRRVLRRAAFLTELGEIRKGRRVLEIGCGVGTFTEKLSEKGAQLTALDISFDFVRKAHLKLDPHARCLVANAMQIPFSAETFDSVVGSSILHHLNVEETLKECWRVLRPGGCVALAEPNMLNPQIFVMKNVPVIKRWMKEDPDETAFIRWRLARTFRQLGFKEVRAFPYDYLHPSIPRPLVPLIERMGQCFEQIPFIREFAGSLIIIAKKPMSDNGG